MSYTTELILTAMIVVPIIGLIFWLDHRSKPKKSVQDPTIAVYEGHPGPSRLLRLLAILILGIAGIIATFYGAIWVRQNPVAGLPVLIGMIVLYLLLRALHAFRILYKIFGPPQTRQIK